MVEKASTFLFLVPAIFDFFSKIKKIGRACKSVILKAFPLVAGSKRQAIFACCREKELGDESKLNKQVC